MATGGSCWRALRPAAVGPAGLTPRATGEGSDRGPATHTRRRVGRQTIVPSGDPTAAYRKGKGKLPPGAADALPEATTRVTLPSSVPAPPGRRSASPSPMAQTVATGPSRRSPGQPFEPGAGRPLIADAAGMASPGDVVALFPGGASGARIAWLKIPSPFQWLDPMSESGRPATANPGTVQGQFRTDQQETRPWTSA